MNQAIRVIGVCLLLSGFVVAGCGGDDDGSGGEGATTGAEAGNGQSESVDGGGGELEPTSESKEEYVAKANALCQKRKQQMQAKVAKTLKDLANSDASQQAALRQLIEEAVAPGLEAEIEELRELGAPEGEEEQAEAVIDAIEAFLVSARDNPKEFVNSPGVSEKAQKLPRQYGIGACGRVS